MGNYTRNLILLNVGVAAIGIGLGVIIGYFSHPDSTEPSWTDTVRRQLRDIDPDTISKYIDQVSPDNLRTELQYLAQKPHMATTPIDDELAEYINDKWKNYLDETRLVSYDILLSFPSSNSDKPNVATAFKADGSVVLKTRTTEIVLDDIMQSSETIVPYYNAFAPSGTVQGKLVYANFGSEDDFAYLASQGVDLNGTIALTKYGRVGRGARTNYAKPYGVIGVLVYSDPENYATEGDVGYPDDWSIPKTGVQRGSTMGDVGDPTTINYPSLKSAYRIPQEKLDDFPVLPLQPIAYEDAERLIQMLSNDYAMPGPDWSTWLNGKVLKVGPGFEDGGELELSVNNELKYVTSKNVIGMIRGETEPDEWVIYGNHRDAWVYGAVDPSSGTTCLLELTRILGNMLEDGWRPKRSMIFGSWGAEEFGLIGSVEWAEEFEPMLSERSVAYINVDIAVYGNSTLNAAASRTMSKVLLSAAAKVEDPMDSSKTVLDTWKTFMPDPDDTEKPNVKRLGSGSDYYIFYHTLGISSVDLSYRSDPNDKSKAISPYPTYHTAYDTFDYVDKFMDPGFMAHATVCKVAGTAMILMADSLIIPFDPRDMAASIQKQIDEVDKYRDTLGEEKIGYLKEAGTALTNSANNFIEYTEETLDRTNLAKIAAVNSRLRLFERSFIEPAALPGQVTYKHISGYSNRGSFGSIDELLYENDSPSEEDVDLAKQQLAMITYRILNAANMLDIEPEL